MRLFGSVTNFVQNVNEYGWLGRVLDVQVESPDINFASFLHEDRLTFYGTKIVSRNTGTGVVLRYTGTDLLVASVTPLSNVSQMEMGEEYS